MKLKNHGQALIPILLIMLMVLTLGVGSLHLGIGGLLLSSYSLTGERVLMACEGAMENGLIKILRNPAYSGESLQVSDFNCTINASGSNPTVLVAECDSGRSIRRLQAEVNFVNGEMIVNNLKEIE